MQKFLSGTLNGLQRNQFQVGCLERKKKDTEFPFRRIIPDVAVDKNISLSSDEGTFSCTWLYPVVFQMQ